MIALSAVDVCLEGEKLFHIAKFVLKEGERCGLLAPNGTGKTVFFEQLASKNIYHNTSIAYGSQRSSEDFLNSPSLNHCVMHAPEGFDAQEFYNITQRFLLDLDRPLTTFSGGQQRQAWLAYTLAQNAQVLLLDEPTNHLDLPSILWLQQYLLQNKKTYVIVSHDRYFLDALVDGYYGIYEKQLRYYHGKLRDFEQKREVEEQTVISQQRCEDQSLAQEERYKERGVTARRKRNQGRLERLEQLREKVAGRSVEAGLDFSQQTSTGLPAQQQIVRLTNAVPQYYDPVKLKAHSLPPVDVILTRQERVALVGANGRGKTTLLRHICEKGPGVWLRENLNIGVVDQHRTLDETRTVGQLLSIDPHRVPIQNHDGTFHVLHPVTYLAGFGFKRDDLTTPVAKLSGGQRMKLCLALLMRQPIDLLILDEPTNDLDLESLEELADFIAQFPSLVILISHDRYLIDQCATQTWYLGATGLQIDRGGVDDLRLKNLFAKAPESESKKLTPGRAKWQSHDRLIQKIEKFEEKLAQTDEKLSQDPSLFDPKNQRMLEEILQKRASLLKNIEELYEQLI